MGLISQGRLSVSTASSTVSKQGPGPKALAHLGHWHGPSQERMMAQVQQLYPQILFLKLLVAGKNPTLLINQ